MKQEELFAEFLEPLRAFIARRVDSAHVDDITQDVFLKIAANIGTLKDEQKLRAWIYQIARNAITDHYRRHQNSPVPLEMPETIEAAEASEPDRAGELSLCVRPLVRQLPAKYREALELTEFEGISQKELSERLGISSSGARSRVQRARTKLKDILVSCCTIETDSHGTITDFSKRTARGAAECAPEKSSALRPFESSCVS